MGRDARVVVAILPLFLKGKYSLSLRHRRIFGDLGGDFVPRTGPGVALEPACTIFPPLNLLASLSTLRPIALSEIAGASLLDRLDQKLIISEAWLPEILAFCRDLNEADGGAYQVLEVNEQRCARYENLFFDGPGFDAFNDHVRGRKIRHKARIRNYGSNGQTFLEIKRKTVHGRTVKDRLQRLEGMAWDAPLSAEEQVFFTQHFPYANVASPVLQSHFQRFTLVHPGRGERVTFDTGLSFHLPEGRLADEPGIKKTPQELPGVVVMEIKQARIDRQSPIHQIIARFLGAHPPLGRPTRLSKYILGVGLVYPQLPLRTYLPVFRDIQRSLNA